MTDIEGFRRQVEQCRVSSVRTSQTAGALKKYDNGFLMFLSLAFSVVIAFVANPLFSLIGIVFFFLLLSAQNSGNAEERQKFENAINSVNADQKSKDSIAEFQTNQIRALLLKSHEIAYQLLPFYESSARRNIAIAKDDFIENAFSPFWSNIETASESLSLFKEALKQLQINRNLYERNLSGLNHNFPTTFPIGKGIKIQDTLEEFRTIVRKAHTHPTFSIIWEQRRNTRALYGGFNTLENAINNLGTDIVGAIENLQSIQTQQLDSLQESHQSISNVLSDIDTKMYYVQWKRKPPDKFEYR